LTDGHAASDHRPVRLDDLAKHLSDRTRIGITPELADRLTIRSEDATRGQLLAQQEDDRGHLGVHVVGVYVVDDTDFWDDGEIYWWAIPTLVDRDGKATWDPLSGLPTGAPPHKCGSLEWMTNVSLSETPLLALIPPGDDLAACVLRLAIYDDDGELADVPKAITAGLTVLAGFTERQVAGPDQIIAPVREAIFRSLKADDDDILIDQDLILRRGEASRFGRGFVGSVVNAMVRVYYFVRDEQRTEQVGPFALHKGQVETVRFQTPVESGGRVALFARGAEVNTTSFGNLTVEMPFINRALDTATAKQLADGFNLNGTGPAKVIAYYTPP
jgi:hypothetical protein